MANTNKQGDGSKLFLNEFDISGAVNSHNFNAPRTVADTRTFAGNDKTASTVHDPTCDFSGWAVYGTDAFNDNLFALITSEIDSTAGIVYGGTAGDVAYEVVGKTDSDSLSASVGAVNTAGGSLQGEYFGRGLAIDLDRAVTGTGAGTGQNVGTVANTHFIVIRCTAATALTTMAVTPEGSSDNGSGDAYAALTGYTWAVGGSCTEASDVLTFTDTGYAIGYKASASAEAWVRMNVTTWTGTSATLQSMAGEAIGQN